MLATVSHPPEITHSTHMRWQAERNEARFEALIEDAPEAILLCDSRGRVERVNAAAARLFATTRDGLIGKSMFHLAPTSLQNQRDPGAAMVDIGRRVLAGEHVVVDWVVQAFDGHVIPVQSRWMRLPGEKDLLRALVIDVSDRTRAEAELRESEARFRQLTLLSSDWYWEQDAEYRFIDTREVAGRRNKPAREMVGLKRWECPGTRPIGTTWAAHRADLDARRAFAHLVLEMEFEGGLRRYVAVRGEPIFGAQGEFTGYRGVGTDITERYRSDLVRLGERRLFELFSADAPLDELMSTLCRNLEAVLARPGFASLMLRDKRVLRLCAAPSAPAAFGPAVAAGVDVGPASGSCGTAVFTGEVVVCADIATDPRWEAWRDAAARCAIRSSWSTPVRGSAGQVIGTIAVYAGVALAPIAADLEQSAAAAALAAVLIERFRAEAAERESEQRYRSLVEVSQDGVLISDFGRIQYANPALARMLKAAGPQDLLGRNLLEMIVPEHRALAQERARRVAQARLPVGYAEMRVVCLDGSIADIEICGTPIEVGGRRLVQSNVRDISARKWAEREMKRLNESLEQRVAERTAELSLANEALEAFSYTVAHDLRAPLRAIDGFARMLAEGAAGRLDDVMHRDLEMICRNARRMAGLIDGLLDFSRLARDPPARGRVSMRELAEAAAAESREEGGPERAVAACIDVGDLPVVRGDAALLRQVWSNLIGNAVKFSANMPAPRIEVRHCLRDGENVFTVRDNGVGFDARFAGKLFGVFQRLHSQAAFPGTGVGLAIVRRIVERHGGRVFAESPAAGGAVFGFTLPALPGTPGMPAALATPAAGHWKPS